MKPRDTPSIEYLRKHFRIDSEWRLERFTHAHGWRLAAKQRGGKDYFYVGILGKQYLAHRIIWTLHYGAPPSECLDHINGKAWDNRIENLREATKAQNRWNTALTLRTNKTGFHRVHPHHGGFVGKVRAHGRIHVTPSFDDAELAGLAASELADRLHGEFAAERRAA